ncbi:hypothetical protein AB1399_06680, partial [Hydrogenibacillus schlegelii]|uniref:hypothetical protein n=1 Tax=Hydrogenibacillus schlegelii TaxID=1484 RepID=UPI00349FF001
MGETVVGGPHFRLGNDIVPRVYRFNLCVGLGGVVGVRMVLVRQAEELVFDLVVAGLPGEAVVQVV